MRRTDIRVVRFFEAKGFIPFAFVGALHHRFVGQPPFQDVRIHLAYNYSYQPIGKRGVEGQDIFVKPDRVTVLLAGAPFRAQVRISGLNRAIMHFDEIVACAITLGNMYKRKSAKETHATINAVEQILNETLT